MKIDVLLLADGFEKFLDMCLEYYGLDPFHCFRSPQDDWNSICICLLKEEWEKVCLTLLKDTVKPIINTWNHMIISNQVNTSYISKQRIYTTGQWVNILLTVSLNGKIKEKLRDLM